jgi:hypothetical protein
MRVRPRRSYFCRSQRPGGALTRAETALLVAFINSPRRVLSRDVLRYAIVGRGAEPYDRSVDMLVARLRRKIEPDPKTPRFILSVKSVGYKFAVRPQRIENGKSLQVTDPEQFNGPGVGEVMSAPGSDQGFSDSEKRQLTVLSCGLIGSAALAVNLDPEDFGITIRRFQEICTRVITRWGGAAINFVGDEILASFGTPSATRIMLNAPCAQASNLWQMSVTSDRSPVSDCR